MCKAIEKAHYFSQGSNFKAWISVIMRNIFINKYRKQKRENHVPLCEDIVFVEHPVTFADAEFEAFSQEVQTAISKLSTKNQEVINLFIRGISYEDIAERLQLPIGTVKSRIHHARKILRKKVRYPSELN
jgi:RNA polymerase sigma-70 factor (ECF subfamily)